MDAGSRFERVRAAIEQLGPADHACTLYDQRDEEVAIAVSYIRAGLDRGELCVCVVDDGGESILDALASEGVDIEAEMRSAPPPPQVHCLLKNCTALSCFFAAASDLKVPRFFRFPVFGSFFRE
jgi:hypothetical protein